MEAVKSVNLVKVYRGKEEVEALKGVSISIKRGELFTLLGPNGAGKTTFLRIVSTQLLPTRGDVYVLGYDVINEPEEVRKHIAVAPQDAITYGSLTPWDYAYYFALLRGMSKADAKDAAERALKIVGLWDLRKRTCFTLSGGENKRAIIAAALSSDADVFMLDEPTSGLDAVARRRVWSALREMVKEGKTVLLTTHMMEEAEIVSDRLAVINKGLIVAEGDVNEIKCLIKEKYRVVVYGEFDELSGYGNVTRIGDRCIVYVNDEGDALKLLRACLGRGLRAEVSTITLEDVFAKLVGGLEDEGG